VRPILVDTHAFLWFAFGDTRLSDRAAAEMESPATRLILSSASLWEMAIKHQIGKLRLEIPFARFVERFVLGTDLVVAPVELSAILEVAALPLHHRDPFDRLLIAEARVRGCPILTSDAAFSAYDVDTIW
jgi:PIN domain nuclease of toxin-antitoxin system